MTDASTLTGNDALFDRARAAMPGGVAVAGRA